MSRSKSSVLRTVEINIISGEGLRINRKQPVKKNAFVIVRTSADSNNTVITNMDTEGGGYPTWNQKLAAVDIPMHSAYFTLEVQCKSFSGDQFIGFATVPVSDFTGPYFPTNYLHFLSYRLRDRKGERNGIINLSVRVKAQSSADHDHQNGGGYYALQQPWMAAPARGKVLVAQGTAMGIPVW